MHRFTIFLLLVLAWIAPVRGQQEPFTGTIEGTVRRTDSAEPIANNPVTLQKEGEAVRMVETDANGRFSFKGLTPGEYRFETRRNGYFAMGEDSYAHRETIDLDPNQPIKNVAVKLIPGATISGRVVDADGEPVVGSEVSASIPAYARGGVRLLMPVASGRTDDRGMYRIFWLPPGEYYVGAQYLPATPGMGSQRHWTYYPGTRNEREAALVSVNAGADINGINFTAIEPPSQLTYTISGKVTGLPPNAAEKSVERLFLVPSNTTSPIGGDSWNNKAADRSKGQFELRGILPGAYDIFPDVEDADQRKYTARVSVVVVDRNIENVAIQVGPGVDVRGRILVNGSAPEGRLGNPSITVDSKDGVPVFLLVSLSFFAVPSVRPTVDADSGVFQLHGLPPGRYELRFETVLPDDYYVSDVRQNGQSVMDGFRVGSQTPEPLEIVVNSPGGVVDGIVQDANGNPVRGATVVLVPEQRLRQRQDRYSVVTTNGQSRFRISRIVPGEYKLLAWTKVPDSAWQNEDFLLRYEQRGIPVSIKAGSPLTVQLRVIGSEP